jgi:hypothetical protein
VEVTILERGRANDSAGSRRVRPDALAGEKPGALWNAFNYGDGGRTWLYLDDVSLQVCVPQ